MKSVSALITKLRTTVRTQLQILAQQQVRTGRHQAPSPFRKAWLRAGTVALGVVAVGGIVAISLTSNYASAAPSASLGQVGHQGRFAHAEASPGSARSGPVTSPGSRRAVRQHGAAASAHGARPARSSSHGPAPASAGGQPTSRKHGAPAVRCTGTSGMLPQNYATIVGFLTTHGYTKLAAAGIAGNMYQESMGNPESVGTGGGGLIGWTPLPAGFVTGNVAADLHTQLEAVLTYNQQWAQYLPMLNAATTASQAADVYMTYFERPGIPAAYNREAAAVAVASACGF